MDREEEKKSLQGSFEREFESQMVKSRTQGGCKNGGRVSSFSLSFRVVNSVFSCE